MPCSSYIRSKSKVEIYFSIVRYTPHRNMDSAVIQNVFCYYLEGFNFQFPCQTLVPSLKELPIYSTLYIHVYMYIQYTVNIYIQCTIYQCIYIQCTICSVLYQYIYNINVRCIYILYRVHYMYHVQPIICTMLCLLYALYWPIYVQYIMW